MIRCTLIAFFAIAGATARAADPVAAEVKKLQGEWRLVEAQGK